MAVITFLACGGREAVMTNHLKMAKARAIQALREQGWSYRRIARTLWISRVTVRRAVAAGRADPPPQDAHLSHGPESFPQTCANWCEASGIVGRRREAPWRTAGDNRSDAQSRRID